VCPSVSRKETLLFADRRHIVYMCLDVFLILLCVCLSVSLRETLCCAYTCVYLSLSLSLSRARALSLSLLKASIQGRVSKFFLKRITILCVHMCLYVLLSLSVRACVCAYVLKASILGHPSASKTSKSHLGILSCTLRCVMSRTRIIMLVTVTHLEP
jgi:hypothetical protein